MDQITVISVCVVAFALLLPAFTQRFSRNPKLFRKIKYVIFGVYILANLYETILFRNVREEGVVKLIPFWSYAESISMSGGLKITNGPLLEQIVLNILLYIPLGHLLPFIWPKLQKGIVSWKVVLIGLICSAATELSHLIFRIGWFEFDDMINNAMGCLIGCVMYGMICRWNTGEGIFFPKVRKKSK